MNTNIDKQLAKVPAVSKRELLFYILNNCPTSKIKIKTITNNSYTALVLNIGSTKEEGVTVVIQLYDNYDQLTQLFIHINVSHIESIQFDNQTQALEILSLGTASQNLAYSETSKLELQRLFLSFPKTILASTQVNLGEPQMELPDNKLELNRIFKTTQTIQTTIENLLQAEDAKQYWKQKYNSIEFINNDYLEIKSENNTVKICFPFNNTLSPEIDTKDLLQKLMSIL